MKTITSLLVLFFAFSACSDNCITCTIEDRSGLQSEEICDEEDVTYTDFDGKVIPFDSIQPLWEAIGYTCE